MDLKNEKSNPLGQKVKYTNQYNPDLLFKIERKEKRIELGLADDLPFIGEDIWNAYEISWLNKNGLPQIAVGEFIFNAMSTYLVESKSLKLYLNSFNQSTFSSIKKVQERIESDLSKLLGSPVVVNISNLSDSTLNSITQLEKTGSTICLDDQEVKIETYEYEPSLLKLKNDTVIKETVFSHLLKSNCLITNQPDWATLLIEYEGHKICHQSLLKYIISFRNHNEFHEQCVERIFVDLMKACKPKKLTVYARYTRRGGLDINPWRSNHLSTMENFRLCRQ